MATVLSNKVLPYALLSLADDHAVSTLLIPSSLKELKGR